MSSEDADIEADKRLLADDWPAYPERHGLEHSPALYKSYSRASDNGGLQGNYFPEPNVEQLRSAIMHPPYEPKTTNGFVAY